jgi:hypothetical protein
MKKFLKYKLWPVIAGLLSAFIIIMIFEFINSFFYTIPEGLDTSDVNALHEFTASLPWTAYILVFLGWVIGSFKAGCVTAYLAKESRYRMSFVVGIILTLIGIANNMIIGHDTLFNILALPVFIIFTYLGHRYLRKVYEGRDLTI